MQVIISLVLLSFRTPRIHCYPLMKSLLSSLLLSTSCLTISVLLPTLAVNCLKPRGTILPWKKNFFPFWKLSSPIVLFFLDRLSLSSPTNLTFGKQQSQRALRWLLVIAEFNVCLVHRDGSKNHAADALSCLPLLEPEEPLSVEQAHDRFHESYLFYPVQHHMQELCPVTLANLRRSQQGDAALLCIMAQRPENYCTTQFGEYDIIEYRKSADQDWRIVVPQEIVPSPISCYHKFLGGHPGTHLLMSTISQHFAFPSMKPLIEKFVRTCDTCQKVKPYHPRDGLLPPKDPELDPWY
jgi:hypothetical protein